MTDAPPDPRSGPPPATPEPIDAQLRGEVFKTVSGQLLGTYRIDLSLPPPLGELLRAVERRVAVDRERIRHRARSVRVEAWSGGLTPDGRGRWEADIVALSPRGSWRRAGRVRLTLQLVTAQPAGHAPEPGRRAG